VSAAHLKDFLGIFHLDIRELFDVSGSGRVSVRVINKNAIIDSSLAYEWRYVGFGKGVIEVADGTGLGQFDIVNLSVLDGTANSFGSGSDSKSHSNPP
jgi:hypothetical protein